MGCRCGSSSFQRNTTNGVYGPRAGFKSAPRDLPTPVLKQMALRKQVNEQARKEKQAQLKSMRQKIVKDKISQTQQRKKPS